MLLYFLLLFLRLLDFRQDLLQLDLIGFHAHLQDLLLFLQLFVGDCVLMDFRHLPFRVRVVLLHHHVQASHLCFQFLYLLFRKLFVLFRQLEVAIGFCNFGPQIRDCVGIIVRVA